MKPFISIIIPVYNMVDRIGRSLDSIVCQSFKDVEIIVVDDGSTDGTGDIVRGYASEDSRVRYIHQENSGVSVARNSGLEAASGKNILFIDADDEIEENYLKNIAGKAVSTGADILVWGIKRRFEDGHIEEWKPELEGSYDRKGFLTAFPREQYWLHKGLFGFVSNKLVKKSIVDAYDLRFDETMTLMEDFDFFLRCFAKCESFYCFPETGYLYNISASGSDSGRYSDSLYRQLITVHTKCADLLKSEGALNSGNERILAEAIANLSLAGFLEMRKADYPKIKTYMGFLWDNSYCVPAVKAMSTRWKFLRHMILNKSVLGAFLFVAVWRLYLFSKTRGRS